MRGDVRPRDAAEPDKGVLAALTMGSGQAPAQEIYRGYLVGTPKGRLNRLEKHLVDNRRRRPNHPP